jgi:hypothetical protein
VVSSYPVSFNKRKKMKQVQFKKSPTGAPFYLAYNVGDIAEVSEEQAALLHAAGIIDMDAPVAPQSNVPQEPITPEPVAFDPATLEGKVGDENQDQNQTEKKK